jgi:hypothetical protein
MHTTWENLSARGVSNSGRGPPNVPRYGTVKTSPSFLSTSTAFRTVSPADAELIFQVVLGRHHRGHARR